MEKQPTETHTLCPDQMDLMTEAMNWLNLARMASNDVVKFDHSDVYLRSVALSRKLYETPEVHASLNPRYKSLNHMVETLIWRELGSSSEFLQFNDPVDRSWTDAKRTTSTTLLLNSFPDCPACGQCPTNRTWITFCPLKFLILFCSVAQNL